MSTLTLQHVMDTESKKYVRAAIAWAALAEDIDNAYEQVRQGLKFVDRGARGDAARAAVGQLVTHGHRISNSYSPARRVSEALEQHAYAFTQLHELVLGVTEQARRRGVHLDWQTNQVSAPTVGRVGEDPPWTGQIAALRKTVDEILARARRLDEDATAAIRGALPSPVSGGGFGASLAFGIDRATVEQWVNGSPYEVHAWWLSLSPEQQEQVIRDYPELAGTFDGVPATDRDRANRVNLQTQLSSVQDRVADLHSRIDSVHLDYAEDAAKGVHFPPLEQRIHDLNEQLGQAEREQAGLRAVRDKLSELGAPALLMGIVHAGDGKAIVAMGDPDTAKHVAVFVPGVNTDLLDIGGDMDRVRNLQEAAEWSTVEPNDVSVVHWLGYDPPGYDVGALTDGASKEGGKWFTPFVRGLHATHQQDAGAPHVTAVGHSYGSTVVAEAAMAGGLRVTDIVTAGSPGMHTDHATNLNIDPEHVWGGVATDDWVGRAAAHGEEPTDPAFGSNSYVVDTLGHGGYWTQNSVSLDNQAFIVTGQYGRVTLEFGSAPTR